MSKVEDEKAIQALDEANVKDEQRFVVPNFTVKQLLTAIPAECFERSALHSSLYILQDVVCLAAFWKASTYFPLIVEKAAFGFYASKALTFALWSAYWFASGLAATGLWVIAHECGHQAFSTSKTINNAVGWVLHSALGVPYHAWRISHGRHHAHCGHLTQDEVFVPRTRSQLKYPAFDAEKEDVEGFNVTAERRHELSEAIHESPAFLLFWLAGQQLIGWQMYLIRNASGQKWYPKFTNHFQTNSIIFDKRHYRQIVASDIGLLLTIGGLIAWGYFRGFQEVFNYYIVSYIWMNHWLVSIVYLQHTDPLVPHYSANEWNFARGALTTIDRNCMGWVGPVMLHGICETHVSHHVSSKIPHYNAWKATAALKEYLGPHYQCRTGSFWKALYTSYRDCRFIEDGVDIPFYKNGQGVAQMVAAEDSSKNISDSGVDVKEE